MCPEKRDLLLEALRLGDVIGVLAGDELPRASRSPRFRLRVRPMFCSFSRIRMRGSAYAFRISRVPSVEPSSRMRNSKSPSVWFRMLSTASRR
jgi:hypothetical protein